MLPLFPLNHVLLPGMPLPLHIFEARYRKLLADLADGPHTAAFGVVALRTGTEAASPHVRDARTDVETVGTVAEILETETNEDGSSDLLCVGSQRFRVVQLVRAGTPYLRGEVAYLDEADGELTGAALMRARELMSRYDAVLARLAGRTTGAELPDDAALLAYQLGARLPLTPPDRQALLEDATTAERLARLDRLLRRELVLLQHTRSIAVAPTVLRIANGIN